jgi:hypothetical protein
VTRSPVLAHGCSLSENCIRNRDCAHDASRINYLPGGDLQLLQAFKEFDMNASHSGLDGRTRKVSFVYVLPVA